ncbi:hypothetical protein TNCV_2499441 [Trichonephila clavipes]|nr:hypothetical protein TNCV_2499441 [Trichonephila clavipes]
MRTSTFLTLIKVELQRSGIAVYRIAAHVGRDPTTVSRIWPAGNMEDRDGSQWTPITSSRQYRHSTLMVFMDHASPFMSQESITVHLQDITMVDDLRYRVEAAGSSVPVHAIQSMFDSMPWRIRDVITARDGCSGY